MNKAIKKRWIKALRSGGYKQAEGFLHIGDGFCCLGVLCDIEIDGDWIESPSFFGEHSWSINGDQSSLPESFRAKCGITDEEENKLIELNDGEEADFNTIANWIEKSL